MTDPSNSDTNTTSDTRKFTYELPPEVMQMILSYLDDEERVKHATADSKTSGSRIVSANAAESFIPYPPIRSRELICNCSKEPVLTELVKAKVQDGDDPVQHITLTEILTDKQVSLYEDLLFKRWPSETSPFHERVESITFPEGSLESIRDDGFWIWYRNGDSVVKRPRQLGFYQEFTRGKQTILDLTDTRISDLEIHPLVQSIFALSLDAQLHVKGPWGLVFSFCDAKEPPFESLTFQVTPNAGSDEPSVPRPPTGREISSFAGEIHDAFVASGLTKPVDLRDLLGQHPPGSEQDTYSELWSVIITKLRVDVERGRPPCPIPEGFKSLEEALTARLTLTCKNKVMTRLPFVDGSPDVPS